MKIKTLINILVINLILFLTIISKSYTKPIPPGSGEGDVPANILILLDSSVSMRNLVSGGMGTYGIDWAVELSDGNIIFSGHHSLMALPKEEVKSKVFKIWSSNV